jgi:sugar lactone lactonase YvrE
VTGVAVASTTTQALLGEGARWDARRSELLVVDIVDGLVVRGALADDGDVRLVRGYRLATTVGAVAPIDGDDGWIVAAGRGIVHLTPDGDVHPLAELAPGDARMNDGACDPLGRFWAGTLAHDHRPGGGALYRFGTDGHSELMIDGLTISNGIGWSPDGTTMYLVDSGPRVVHAYGFDPATGAIAGRSTLITVPEEVGAPDGLTIDAAGDLWVAIYGGGRVHHYAPDGELREVLAVPAAQTTSCAFAGPRLDRLYVTTATENWSDEQRRAEPTAGLVYRIDTDATGRPADPYRPDPGWWATVTSA